MLGEIEKKNHVLKVLILIFTNSTASVSAGAFAAILMYTLLRCPVPSRHFLPSFLPLHVMPLILHCAANYHTHIPPCPPITSCPARGRHAPLMLTPCLGLICLQPTDTTMSSAPAKANPAANYSKEHYPFGINFDFINPDMSTSDLVGKFGLDDGGGRFENPEKRDIAANVDNIISLLNLTKDSNVADVGAGTGLLLSALSKSAGSVTAVDLSPAFCDHMKLRVTEGKLENVNVMLCSSSDIGLPKGEFDVAILIDVYHHIEFPKTTIRQIRSCLKEGGKLVVLDFHRIPEKITSFPEGWILNHVRAGQEVRELSKKKSKSRAQKN